MNLLATNHKLEKPVDGWSILGLSLAPADIAIPGKSVCPWSTENCLMVCNNTSGMAQVTGSVYQGESPEERHERFMSYQIHRARIMKTVLFLQSRDIFMSHLNRELSNKKALAFKKGLKLAIRLNVFSDISWENIRVIEGKSIIEAHPDLQFYDYTKGYQRALKFLRGEMPSNYDLTFSRSEVTTLPMISTLIDNKVNVAVVFRTVPDSWEGYEVIKGDLNDHRFLDKKGVIVGLKEKARASKDRSGFVYE